MLAARQRHALFAKLAVESQFAPAFAWPPTVPLQRIASFPTNRHVAEITGPTCYRGKLKKKKETTNPFFIDKETL